MFKLHIALPLSVALAILLQLLPLGANWSAYQPSYLLLVMFFWVARYPASCGIGCAATLGLIADLLYTGWLGQQLLSFSLASYLLISFNRVVLSPTLVQQSLSVMVLSTLVGCLQVAWAGIDGADLPYLPALVGGLISGVIWPLVVVALEPLYESGEIR